MTKEAVNAFNRLPEVLILAQSTQHKDEVMKAITSKLLKGGNFFTRGYDYIRTEEVYINFRDIGVVNRDQDTLQGRRFVNYFQKAAGPILPSSKLINFLGARFDLIPQKGVPAWLVNLLIGLQLT